MDFVLTSLHQHGRHWYTYMTWFDPSIVPGDIEAELPADCLRKLFIREQAECMKLT